MGVGVGVTEFSLAGRDREFGELRDAVGAATAGSGTVFLISGEPGIGKTRLASTAAEHAESCGHLVLWGRAWESGGAPPFWPWTQVLRACERLVDPQLLADAAGAVSPGALLSSPSAARSSAAPEDRFGLYDATTAFLLRLSTAVPLTIVLDDLHAADEPTLQLLRFAADQLDGARILVLGTFRETEADADPSVGSLLNEVARRGLHLPLRGLDRDGVGRLVETALDEPDDDLAAELHERTGGNPFLIGEILRLRRSGDQAGRVPSAAREIIRRRVDQLPAETVTLLVAAAVVGRSFSATLIQHLLELDAAEVLERLASAVDARLVLPGVTVGTWQFAHGLIRETLYEDLPDAERAATHARMVDVLDALHVNDRARHLSEIAHHAVAAVPVGDTDRAIDRLLEAVEHATATLAHEEAARLLERALGLAAVAGGDDRRRVELLVRLMEAHAAAGRLDEVERLYEETARAAQHADLPILFARAALARTTVLYEVWVVAPDRIRALRDAIAFLGDEDPRLRAMLLARLVTSLVYTWEPVEELAEEALSEARRSGHLSALAAALNVQRHAVRAGPVRREHLAPTDEAIEISTRIGDLSTAAQARHGRIAQLLSLGEATEAQRELDRSAADARAARSPHAIWNSMAVRAFPELLHGRWDRALELAGEAAQYGRRMRSPLTMSVWGVQTFLAMIERDQLRELLEVATSLPEEFTRPVVTRAGFAWVDAMAGNHDRARAEMDVLAADGFAMLPADTTRYCALVFCAATAVEIGDRQRAAELVDLIEPYSGLVAHAGGWAVYGPHDLYLGQLHGLLGDGQGAEERLRAAIDVAGRMGSAPWEAHGRVQLAKVLLARGSDRESAEELLRSADAVAEELGMRRLSRMIDEIRTVSGVHTPGPEPAARALRFELEGEFWTIQGASSPFRLKDVKGLRYLAQLLANPELEVHVMALVHAERGVKTAPPRSAPEDGLTGSYPSDAGPILDAQAKAAYRRRIGDLQEEIDEATAFNDPERRAKAQEELDLLVAELARATGIGGRDRRAASPVERTRVNVTKTIRSALKRIAKEDAELGTYLEATVRTGTYCAYEPSRAPVTRMDASAVAT